MPGWTGGRRSLVGRRLYWPGFLNARDLGGLPLRPGGETRFGVLIRSDLPGGTEELGPQALVDYGVRTVIDLRSPRELVDRPNPLRDLPDYRHLPLLLDRDLDSIADIRDIARTYRWNVDNRGEAIVGILRSMAEAPPGGILFHCFAGKDRTGVIAALLLAVAGVDRHSIIEDYVLSEGTVPVQFRPLPEMMADLLDHLDRRHGGVAAYLAAAGAETAMQETLRRLLEHAS
jgi:protein-tyrosine phosphatase